MEKRNKTVDSIKINVNDYRVDSGYSYRLVENSNLDLLVDEIQGTSDEDKSSELELDNDSSIYGIDNIWSSLDEEFVQLLVSLSLVPSTQKMNVIFNI